MDVTMKAFKMLFYCNANNNEFYGKIISKSFYSKSINSAVHSKIINIAFHSKTTKQRLTCNIKKTCFVLFYIFTKLNLFRGTKWFTIKRSKYFTRQAR